MKKVKENRISEIKKTIESEVELESLQIPELMKNYIKKWYFPEQ